jgi:mono/diheme cytochrome c family protein
MDVHPVLQILPATSRSDGTRSPEASMANRPRRKRALNRIVVGAEIVAAVVIVVFVVVLFSRGGGNDSGGGSGAATTGAQLFAANCATCHGVDGQGAVGPQLAGRVTQRFPNVDDQIALVTNGSGGMPSFSGKLSAQQIRKVVEFTRTGLSG